MRMIIYSDHNEETLELACYILENLGKDFEKNSKEIVNNYFNKLEELSKFSSKDLKMKIEYIINLRKNEWEPTLRI